MNLLHASGYETIISIEGLNDGDVNMLEKFADQNLQTIWKNDLLYAKMREFVFVPGHRKYLITLGKHAETFINLHKNSFGVHLSHSTILLKELIATANNNQDCALNLKRYSDIIIWL